MQLCKGITAALGVLLVLSVPALTFAQEGNNLTAHAVNVGAANDTVINFTNTGSSWKTIFPIPGGSVLSDNGNVCVNIYALTAGGGVDWCCQCILIPNSLSSFSALNDLNTNSGGTTLTIKMIATAQGTTTFTNQNPPPSQTVGASPTCDASLVNAGFNTAQLSLTTQSNNALVPGLTGWSRSVTGGEVLLSTGQLSTPEVQRLNFQCGGLKAASGGGGKGYCGGTGVFSAAGFAAGTALCRAGGL